MEYKNFEERMEAYFQEKMSAEERRAFQEEIGQDPESAFLFDQKVEALSDMAIQYMGKKELSEKIGRLRATLPPPPEPELSFLDKLELLFPSRRWAIGTCIGLGLVLVFLGIQLAVPETEAVIAEYYTEPYLPDIAGAMDEEEPVIQIAPEAQVQAQERVQAQVQMSEASGYFKDPDGIGKLSGMCPDRFCVAIYYRAHKHLQEQRYGEAVADFEQVLAPDNWASLSRNYDGIQDSCTVELNLLLARWGKDQDLAAVRKAMARFTSPSGPCGEQLPEKALELEKRLGSPLRALQLF